MIEAKRRFLAFFVLLVAFGLALRAEEPDPGTDPAIVLPTFNVTAEIVGYDKESGWRYCSLPGLEVLRNLSDGTSKDILRNFLMFRSALDSVWPKALTSDQLPAIIVFCDDTSSLNKFMLNLKAVERSASSNGRKEITTSREAGRSLSQGDQAIVVMRTIPNMSDTAAMLESAYISAILERIEKHSSPWLNRGLLKAFAGVSFSNGYFAFPPLTTDETLPIRRAGSVEDLEKALKSGKLLYPSATFLRRESTVAGRPDFARTEGWNAE